MHNHFFYVCRCWWCFRSRTLCTCSHVKYGMKKWTLLFPVLISIKVNELSSWVPETFSLQSVWPTVSKIALFLSRKVPLSHIQSRTGPAKKKKNPQGMHWEETHGEHTLFLSGEGSLPPHLTPPTIGPNSIPFGFGPVASPASQPSLFSCSECFGEASRGRHILLEKIKSLTIDKKIHNPSNWWWDNVWLTS